MKITAIPIILLVIVATGETLKCYNNCGKSKAGDNTTVIPCNTTKVTECPCGEVCSTEIYSLQLSGVKTEVRKSVCDTKTNNTAAYCHVIKTEVSAGGHVANFTCNIEFCEIDLCNTGFCGHVSFFILIAAGLLVWKLF